MRTFHYSRRISAFVVISLFLLLSSCATQKPIVVSFPVPAETNTSPGAAPNQPGADVQMPAQSPSVQPSSTATPSAASAPSGSKPNNPISVPLTEYRSPDNTPSQPAPQSEKDIQDLVTLNNIQFEIHPQQEDYQGGAVIYNYVPNHVYELFVAPLQLTTVMLEPGENIVSAPAAGDTANFMLATTYSVEDGHQRSQLLIKAVYAGKSTTVAVNTDKRSYFFKAISYDKIFMPLVSFNYPLELADKIKAQAADSQSRILMYGRVTDLDFSYQILPHSVHKPSWCPDRVFNDGRKTYMSFPSASRASYAPVLFEVNEKKERILLNYRVVGTYYIVDRVLMHAELVLDVNEGNIVTIVHKED